MSNVQELISQKKKEFDELIKADTKVMNGAFYTLMIVRVLFIVSLGSYVIMSFFAPKAYRKVPGSIPSITGLLNIVAYFQNFSEWITKREEHIQEWRKRYIDIVASEHLADPSQTTAALELLIKNIGEQKAGKPLTAPSAGVAAMQVANHTRETSLAMETLRRSESIRAASHQLGEARDPLSVGLAVSSLGLAVAGTMAAGVAASVAGSSSSSSSSGSSQDTSEENAELQKSLSSALRGVVPIISDSHVYTNVTTPEVATRETSRPLSRNPSVRTRSLSLSQQALEDRRKMVSRQSSAVGKRNSGLASAAVLDDESEHEI